VELLLAEKPSGPSEIDVRVAARRSSALLEQAPDDT
jgi:hypothetical protein